MEDKLVTLHDSNIESQEYISAFTKDPDTKFKKGMYVKIEKNSNSFWIGVISTPNSNICPISQDQLDPMVLTALYEGTHKKTTIEQLGVHQTFKIKLLKFCNIETDENNEDFYEFQMIVDRPPFGAVITELTQREIEELLKIPKFDKNNAIGYAQSIDNLPICIDKKTLHTHILVSGSTGSGKSNVNANLMKICNKYKKVIIIHDAKPDFNNIKLKNDEVVKKSKQVKEIEEKFNYKVEGMNKVINISFKGVEDEENKNRIIYFKPDKFTPEEYCNLFFYEEGEENQYEELLGIILENNLYNYKEGVRYLSNNFSLNYILNKVKEKKEIHPSTQKTIVSKIKRRINFFPWLIEDDRKLEKEKKKYFNGFSDIISAAFNNMNTPPIFLINYEGQGMEITYAFMLNKLLKEIQNYRDEVYNNKNNYKYQYEVVQVIDEAHRLFEGKSKTFRAELINSFNKVIKEGRVKKHSLIVSLQNASEVPDTALNNFGTKIALRQQSIKEAQISTQGMHHGSDNQVLKLSAGEFLIKYPSGEYTFLAKGFMSPFQLRRE